MIQTSKLELGNLVFVDEKLTNTTTNLRGVVIEIKKDAIGVSINDLEIVCTQDQIYPIPLFENEIRDIGFISRVITSENMSDNVMSVETSPTEWYLLTINKDLFLTIYKNGTDIIGSGKVDSHHRLQNLVNQITDGKIKIK